MSAISSFVDSGTKAEPTHVMTGKAGEIRAVTHLLSLGYSIMDLNVKLGRDEIDIIAFDPEDRVVVFAEVKARLRRNSDFSPAMRFTFRKRRAMARAAQKWIAEKNFEGAFRIDAVLVTDGEVTGHYKEMAVDS